MYYEIRDELLVETFGETKVDFDDEEEEEEETEETQSQTETAEAVAALTDQINQDINKVNIVEETQSQTDTAEAVAAPTDQINQDINKVTKVIKLDTGQSRYYSPIWVHESHSRYTRDAH